MEQGSMKQKLCDSSRQLLVTKSSAVITGFMIKSAIALSVASVLLGDEIRLESAPSHISKGEAQQLVTRVSRFVHAISIFCLLLFSAALLARYVHSVPELPQRLKAMYTGGMALIPAWAFKDVVNSFIVLFTETSKSMDVAPGVSILDAVIALFVAMGASALQILCDTLAHGILEEGTLLAQMIALLKTSMGLGVGFAVNNLVNSLVGGQWSYVSLQLIYVLCLTAFVPYVQSTMKSLRGKANDAMPFFKDDRWAAKTIEFLAVSLQFVLGWAWRDWIHVVLGPLVTGQGTALQYQLVLSCIVTFSGTLVTAVVTLGSVPQHMINLCTLVVGLNIGWTWMDFAAVCAAAGGTEVGVIGIGQLWLYTLGIIAVVCMAAGSLEFAIRTIEEPEELRQALADAKDKLTPRLAR